MLSFANNGVISLPSSRFVYDRLAELEFFVCMDVFMTPTAELADIVLPAALWPELDSVFCMPEFSEHSVLCQQKVVQVGQCRPDEEVFIELSRRMGLGFGADSMRELIETSLEDITFRFPEIKGIDFEQMKKLGYYTPKREYLRYKKRGGFNTPTGKYEFYSKEMEMVGGSPLPFWQEPPLTPVSRPDLGKEYPYILTTGGRHQQYFISNNRQIKSLRRQYPFPLVKMHPDTAAQNGIEEGDWVYISTVQGRITQKAKLAPDMDPRVVNCDFGWWYPEAGAPGYGWDESNANILTSSELGCDPYMGSYQLRGILCSIARNDGCKIEERYYSSNLYYEPYVDSSSNCIEFNSGRCVLCGECVRACNETQAVSAIGIRHQDGLTRISARGGRLADSGCVGCGQCRASCRTGAMKIKSDVEGVEAAIADPGTTVVVQVAPSVRVGVGGNLGFPRGANAMPLLIDALHKLGFDKVYDTVIGADLTVIEEAGANDARQEYPAFYQLLPCMGEVLRRQIPGV
jgi:predicted molibdopterin-dependent oxidoreductase YjgC